MKNKFAHKIRIFMRILVLSPQMCREKERLHQQATIYGVQVLNGYGATIPNSQFTRTAHARFARIQTKHLHRPGYFENPSITSIVPTARFERNKLKTVKKPRQTKGQVR